MDPIRVGKIYEINASGKIHGKFAVILEPAGDGYYSVMVSTRDGRGELFASHRALVHYRDLGKEIRKTVV